jgi:glycosyltransferase involved in cell wall biosynthesis
MKLISVVIPALNEEGIIGKTVSSVPVNELRKLNVDVEILVVDNASEDNTAKHARKAGAKVVREEKRGYGNAYLKGFREARGDIIVMLDADGTYPAEAIPQFVKPLLSGEADFAIGSRLRGNIKRGAMPWLHRYLGNPLLTGVLNFLFHTRISDAHCGMRAFTRKALNSMNLNSSGMEFASEMIIEAARNKLRIIEVPVEYRVRGGGKPKLSSFQDGWRHLRFMMLYSPTKLFTLPGAALTFLGLAIFFLLTSKPLKFGGLFFYVHPMILGNLLVLVGLQTIFLGVFNSVYSATKGLSEPDKLTKAVMRYSNLESELVLGFGLFLLGFFAAAKIVYVWVKSGFGELYELKNAIVASTVMFAGIQFMFSAVFLSVLLLDRREER